MARIRLFRTFRLFKAIQRLDGPFGRVLLAISLTTIGLVSTLSVRLSLGLGTEALAAGNNPIHNVRRAIWLVRRSWLPIKLQEASPAFDFTSGLTPEALCEFERFLSRRRGAIGDTQYACDYLAIAARRLTVAPDRNDLNEVFRSACQDVLSTIEPQVRRATRELVVGKKPKVDQTAAKRALRDLADLFQSIDVRFFVLSGTFLGLVRENGFLPHDYDIDAGVMAAEVDGKLIHERLLRSKAFALIRFDMEDPYLGSEHDEPRPMLIKLIHCTGVPVDIFFHHVTSGGLVVHGSSLHYWFNTNFRLAPYILEEVDVWGPEDADRYLTENYGHWRTPVTDFDCSTGTTNLEIVRSPVSVAVFLRRLAIGFSRHSPDSPKLASELLDQCILERDISGSGYRLAQNLWIGSRAAATGQFGRRSDQRA